MYLRFTDKDSGSGSKSAAEERAAMIKRLDEMNKPTKADVSAVPAPRPQRKSGGSPSRRRSYRYIQHHFLLPWSLISILEYKPRNFLHEFFIHLYPNTHAFMCTARVCCFTEPGMT